MKRKILLITIGSILFIGSSFAQEKTKKEGYKFTKIKDVVASAVENQQRAGTCWSYATVGMIEAEMLRMGKEYINLSELYAVRMSYEEKAINYVRMHGHCNFSGAGAVSDVFNILKTYGMMPQEAYTGLNYGTNIHTHDELDRVLLTYLDGVIENKNKELSTAWFRGFKGILDAYLGKVPENFEFNGKTYTPRTFADKIVGVDPENYYFFTSFSHHPFYKPFVLEIPENWTWIGYINIPIDEMITVMDNSINKGYAITWATDISEQGFSSRKGLAVVPEDDIAEISGSERLKWEKMSSWEKQNMLYNFDAPKQEKNITQELRQKAFDNYQTHDDHVMVLTGLAKDQNGTKYYYVKNSWGKECNKMGGFLYASESYVKYKTISFGVHKDVLSKELKNKLGIK